MVYGFMKQSGGHITIDSELGRGNQVQLLLPGADSAAQSVQLSDKVPRVPRRARSLRPHIGVVLMSGYTEQVTEVEVASFASRLTKPFSIHQFVG